MENELKLEKFPVDREAILEKCRICRANQKLTEMEKRLNDGDKRFRKIEDELKENSRVTKENNDMVKEMHEFFFKDTADRNSIQTTLVLNSTQLKWLWTLATTIIVGLAGIGFALIQKNLEPPEKSPKRKYETIYMAAPREDRPYFVNGTKKDKK